MILKLCRSTGKFYFLQRPVIKCSSNIHRRFTQGLAPGRYASKSTTMDTEREPKLETRILPVDIRNIGKVIAVASEDEILDDINIQIDTSTPDSISLRLAAEQLRSSIVPVAFPTETVYGLGADATRSDAVNGIYKAKQRPADNPLIVHFASLSQLRRLLKPQHNKNSPINGHVTNGDSHDPIPEIYRPLISRFWPGPLTIILPNPPDSPLAPEVTAGLETFGARIPRHVLALALIEMANRPIAAPSANASTKPSPTAAEHVAYDLHGRIETIIDGGPCDVGVESTVVDGLSKPPLILRPGGVSIEQLRSCPGWENTQIGYKNTSEPGCQPKSPGMKYRHYSPRAPVFLYEPGKIPPRFADICDLVGSNSMVGVITTKQWKLDMSLSPDIIQKHSESRSHGNSDPSCYVATGFAGMIETLNATADPRGSVVQRNIAYKGVTLDFLEIALGSSTADIARGIFSALRELDKEDVDAIFVEGSTLR